MQSKATTVAAYLAELPEDRRAALTALRDLIRKHIDPGFSEGVGYGMIGWSVPHSRYPAGYHCNPKDPLPFAGLASQKNYMSLYICPPSMGEVDAAAEAEADWFRAAWAKTGKKLDMGKCCIRFGSSTTSPSTPLPNRSGACRSTSSSHVMKRHAPRTSRNRVPRFRR